MAVQGICWGTVVGCTAGSPPCGPRTCPLVVVGSRDGAARGTGSLLRLGQRRFFRDSFVEPIRELAYNLECGVEIGNVSDYLQLFFKTVGWVVKMSEEVVDAFSCPAD